MCLRVLDFSLGAVHIRPNKIDPPPPLSVRTCHKFQKIRKFLHQKVWTFASEELSFVRTGQTISPLIADVLRTAPYTIVILLS